MEYLIIPILLAVVIAVCGIMATLPAPHSYPENLRIYEPTLALPHGAIVNLGGDFDPYPPIYALGTVDAPSEYRKELIRIVRDMITGQFTSTLYLDYRDEELVYKRIPLDEEEWRTQNVNRVIDHNQLMFDFSEDLHLQPHDFHNIIDITEGERE